jgi:hypothetical protein
LRQPEGHLWPKGALTALSANHNGEALARILKPYRRGLAGVSEAAEGPNALRANSTLQEDYRAKNWIGKPLGAHLGLDSDNKADRFRLQTRVREKTPRYLSLIGLT